MLVSVWVPVISAGFPPKAAYPPKITLDNDLFMALHIMYDKIAPDDPIKDPTIVNNGLFNMNPSAHKAHPEYEFKTVMATGISADPIELVMFHPMTDDEIAEYHNKACPNPVESTLANM
eukprot:TRINITY_DN43690_c0_g1_i1.p2 TRINITY_DN43690_c0_g1~~TRINITY_DN43690_c0_g1_i1.p2  ORF type:complete len:119 (-),score=15.30 TRINITY_DN43690_c0_g1_i1:59-415(-)